MTAPEQAPATAAQVAEVNTKLDVLISQHATVAAQVADHEMRMRAVETNQTTTDTQVKSLAEGHTDQEERLRAADRWRYAMPAAAVTGTGALVSGIAALVSALGQ